MAKTKKTSNESPPSDAAHLNLNSAQQELFEAHLPLAKKVAWMAMVRLPANMEFDDIHQAALMGLAQACQRYEAENSVATFETFANPRVRGAVMDHIRHDSPLRRSNVAFQQVVDKASRQLLSASLERVSDAALAEKTGIDISRFIRKKRDLEMNWLIHPTSISDLHRHEDGDEEPEVDAPSDESSDPLSAIERTQRAKVFMGFFSRLTEREQVLLELIEEGETARSISELFEVTEARVSKILTSIQTRVVALMEQEFGERPAFQSTDPEPARVDGSENGPPPVALWAQRAYSRAATYTASPPPLLGPKLAEKRSKDWSPVETEDGTIVIEPNTRWG